MRIPQPATLRPAALGALAIAGLAALAAPLEAAHRDLSLVRIGSWSSGIFAQGGAEIPAFDPKSRRLFVVNGARASLTVLDLSNPAAPVQVAEIPFDAPVNSVDIHDGLVAVAVEGPVKTAPGRVAFFKAGFAATTLPAMVSHPVGALPDMLTFTPEGRYVLVANEGEPSGDYAVDPEGSVSIIDLKGDPAKPARAEVRTVSFAAFDAGGSRASEVPAGLRAFGPGATLSRDVEPEYIAVSEDGRTAYVTLQEHNALAVVDIKTAAVEKLVHLGYKDHSLAANALDASDRDGRVNIAPWPVKGMYQPDAIAAHGTGRRAFLVTANEGDVRDWPGFSEERRVNALALDTNAFPDAASLRQNANLGRLKVTSTLGDADGDGRYESLYAFGGRSFSVWDASGSLLFDSGDQLERLTAATYPDRFNASHDNHTFDDRSDDKGPEPEGLAVATVEGRPYLFLGLERIGGVAVYDLYQPSYPRLVTYANTRDFAGVPASGTAGDLGPEGLIVISKRHSPTGKPLLVVAHEISGSVAVFEIR